MNALESFIASKPCGFIQDKDLPELIKLDRLCPVLVRCGQCRFTCGAQDVAHLVKCIEAGGDWVRDASFPVGSLERAASWKPNCPVTPSAMVPQSFLERPAEQKPGAWSVSKAAHAPFNPADCGGVWDGFSVSSDADPGL